MRTLRLTAVAALVLTAVTMSGCGADAEPTASSAVPTPTISVEPTTSPTPSIAPAPSQSDADVWAEGVMPDNATGGANWSDREVALLEPGREPIITTPMGESLITVVVACQTEDGSPLSYVNTSDIGEVTTGTVECTTDGQPGAGHDITGVSSAATITLTATAAGFIAYSMYALPNGGEGR